MLSRVPIKLSNMLFLEANAGPVREGDVGRVDVLREQGDIST